MFTFQLFLVIFLGLSNGHDPGNQQDPSTVLSQHIEKQYTAEGVNQYICTVCNKSFGKKQSCLFHVESIHFPGVFIYSCDLCGEEFPGRNRLNLHRSKKHVKLDSTVLDKRFN